MKLEFSKYTDITQFAKTINPTMFDIYEKVYICPDTLNWWLSVIQKGVNEDYEEDEDKYLVERDKIDYPNHSKCNNHFLSARVVRTVLENWDGSSWDNHEADDLDEAIQIVDGGWGIIPEED